MRTLLLALSGAKLGKVILTAGTVLGSTIVYGLVFGWWYAAGFVLLIFCHEWATNYRALPATDL